MMKRKMIIFGLLSTMLSGCRTHEYCEYEGAQQDVLGGSVWVYANSTKTEWKEGKKKRAKYGFPYTLSVGFTVKLYREFSESKFVLESLEVTGVDSGKVLSFPGGMVGFTRVRSPDKAEKDQPGCCSLKFEISEDMGVTYEPFDIEADIKIIYVDGTEKSEHIKVRLEKDYKKKRQSDTWDYLRSM